MIGKHCSDIVLSQQRRWLLWNWCYCLENNHCWRSNPFISPIQKCNTTLSMPLKSDFFFFYINDAVKIAIKSCGSGSPSFPLESWPWKEIFRKLFLFHFIWHQRSLNASRLSLFLCAVCRNVESCFGLGQERRSVAEPAAQELVGKLPKASAE